VSLAISTETRDHTNVVHVEGELDVYSAPQLKGILDALGTDCGRVVVDLGAVHFIDSTALGVLVSGHQRVHSNGGQFRLVVDDPFLLKIFHITGFDGTLSIFPKVDDALS